MANLTPTPSWDDVVAWNTNTTANGNTMNAPAQALLNRTEFLKNVADGMDKFKIESVDSFAKLRTFVPKVNGQIVSLKSHTEGKNKGGGFFIFVADSVASDNNGTIAASTVVPGVFARLYDGSFGRYEWFGAQLDGTDDTDAFIAFHKVIKSAKFSGRLKITRPVDVDQFKTGQTLGIKIEGNGTESSYIDFVGCDQGFYSATNTFFRDLTLKKLQLNNVDNDQAGLGLYIGSGGAEQVRCESVAYRGWLIGRSSHTWNSSFRDEVFRVCKHPYVMYGTSTDVSNPYAHTCAGPYMLGYSSDKNGVISIPSVPYAYSLLSGHASDNCGNDGSIYKFGSCSGLTLSSVSCERVQGTHVFDFSDLLGSSMSNVVVNNFTMYVSSANTNIVGLIKKPNVPFGNVVFNDLKVSTDKEIYCVSGDGSGVRLNNPQINNRAWTRLAELAVAKFNVNGVSWNGDDRQNGEIGFSIAANGVSYPRVKNRKGKALIDPNTQKLVLFGGSLSEGLVNGNMFAAIVTAMPINKNGGNAAEKSGHILISSAMDYNASNMAGHLKAVTTGTFTTATTVTRNTANANHLQFDVIIEASSLNTRYLLDLDITYNGISNVNGECWAIVAK